MDIKKINWADIEPDYSSDQETSLDLNNQKPSEKITTTFEPKQPKKWHFLKLPKDKDQRQEISKKRLEHKMQQLNTIESLPGDTLWLYVFKNPNPELIQLVESYPSIKTLKNQMGWDLRITKNQAKKLLNDGFGTNKVHGRMQISRRNYENDFKYSNEKQFKTNKFQNKYTSYNSYDKQSIFQKKKRPFKDLKYKEKEITQVVQAPQQTQNAQGKIEEQCRNQCQKEQCRACFQKTLLSKVSSTNENTNLTSLQITQVIQGDKFTQLLSCSKQQFDEGLLTQNVLNQVLLAEINIPSDQSVTDSLPEISMLQDFSTIQMIGLQQQLEDDQMNLDFEIQNEDEGQVVKKKKKKNKNKQPKPKKISNNPFDKLG